MAVPEVLVRIDGAWVPLGGGGDEVFVGPDAPADSAVELWYDTDAIPALDIAKLPRGQVGYQLGPTTDTIFSNTGSVAIPGTAVTWTADPTRRYRTTATASINFTSATAAGTIGISGSNPTIMVPGGYSSLGPVAASANIPIHLSVVESGLSGPQTRQLAIAANAGTSLMYVGTYARQGSTLVEDIGGV
jgi:hypothetical protein